MNNILRISIRLVHIKWSSLSKRGAILFGLFSGLIVSLIVPRILEHCLIQAGSSSTSRHDLKSANWFEEVINSDYNPIVKLPPTNGSSRSNDQQFRSYNSRRPHFVLEELDVNDQLLIVVLTSDQTFPNLGNLLNDTLTPHADRILFFKQSDVPPSSSSSQSTGSSSLIDLYPSSQPLLLRILSYLDSSIEANKVKSHLRGHNFIFFISDQSYVKGDYLRQLVNGLSIDQRVYAPSCEIGPERINLKRPDCQCPSSVSFYDHFESGLLISNSLISSCQFDLDCLIQACNRSIFNSYRLLPDNRDKLFLDPIAFSDSLIVYPLFTTKVYVNLHHFHLQSSLNNNLRQLDDLNTKIRSFVDRQQIVGHKDTQWSSTWPLGIASPHDPIDRFDVNRWSFTENGVIYMPDDFSVHRQENEGEKMDRQSIESLAIRWLNTHYPNIGTGETKITNVYRRFDANRGLDYILDISIPISSMESVNRQDQLHRNHKGNNKLNSIQSNSISIRVHAVKPLVPMTIIDSIPFATEQNRISLIVPVRSDTEVGDLILLMNQFVSLCSEKQSTNYALIIALITNNSSPPSGYGRVMSMGLSLRTKYPNIKLSLSTVPREPNESYSTSTDLGLLMILRKRFESILTDSIVVLLTSNTLISADYLARIQLNTIKGHQIYFPIPFQEFNLRPGSSGSSDSWRISKDNGLFSWFDYRHVSFYLDDLEKAFKFIFLSSSSTSTTNNSPSLSTINQQLTQYDLLEMFLQSNCRSTERIHILRSIEPELRLRYRNEKCDLDGDIYTINWCNTTLLHSFGNKAQMANLILNYKKSNSPIDWSQ